MGKYQFAESSLDLEVMAWFQTGDLGELRGAVRVGRGRAALSGASQVLS